eukprot:Hpha_TRINITY_DN15433_c0_g2::TRINITY_DN15433_c0_g2_i1::g.175931::m.175931
MGFTSSKLAGRRSANRVGGFHVVFIDPPNEDSALVADRHNKVSVRGVLNLLDVPGVSQPDLHHGSLVVVPEFQDFVGPSGGVGLSVWGDVHRVNLPRLAPLQLADLGALEIVPVSYLLVTTRREDLRLVGIERHRPEVGLCVHDTPSHAPSQVPNDATPIVASRYALGVVGADADGVHRGLVLLHARNHVLGVPLQRPHAHLRVRPSRDQPLTRVVHGQGSDAGETATQALHTLGLVRVVDDVQEFAGLGTESTDLTVAPAGDNGPAVLGEAEAVALQVHDLDTEQLLRGLCVPHTDVVIGTGREELRVLVREGHIVDSFEVTGLPELLFEGPSVEVVHIRPRRPHEVVVAVSRHCRRGSL